MPAIQIPAAKYGTEYTFQHKGDSLVMTRESVDSVQVWYSLNGTRYNSPTPPATLCAQRDNSARTSESGWRFWAIDRDTPVPTRSTGTGSARTPKSMSQDDTFVRNALAGVPQPPAEEDLLGRLANRFNLRLVNGKLTMPDEQAEAKAAADTKARAEIAKLQASIAALQAKLA